MPSPTIATTAPLRLQRLDEGGLVGRPGLGTDAFGRDADLRRDGLGGRAGRRR